MRLVFVLPLFLAAATIAAEKSMPQLSPNWSNYFKAEVTSIEASSPLQVTNLDQWSSRKEQLRRELASMLGLWPMPERTPLQPVVTGKIEREDFTVEKLHFQASPGLYVTANLYLPAKLEGEAPGVLYVCGHSRVVTNGVSCGNKAGYQHHGIWFAQNGFVCLIIDTLQYGEILGSHRGTYSENQWWWNSRGYTPAGIEAWFGIRALDYLCSRPEVDPERIGMTGRSGGGAYTWTVAALDERVKIAAPIAGMTDLRNHVLDGKVDGHCDCMFHINTFRWDFPVIGALIAPRPLLLGNTDKDRIFPLDGVLRTHEQIRSIYRLYDREEDLVLVITGGDHMDTQDLQVPVFRWFTRLLKPAGVAESDKELQVSQAKKLFSPSKLRAFETLPPDERNTTAAKWFNLGPAEFEANSADTNALRERLKERVFAGWPASEPAARLQAHAKTLRKDGVRIEGYDLPIQTGITQQLYSIRISPPKRPRHITLLVADDAMLKGTSLGALEKAETSAIVSDLGRLAPDNDGTVHLLIPRGVGDESFSTKEKLTRMRRRFMLVGQTLDSMRVWDVRCAATALKQLYGKMPITVAASGPMAVNASFAALFQPEIEGLNLTDLPDELAQMPDYLNVTQIVDGLPRAAAQPAGLSH